MEWHKRGFLTYGMEKGKPAQWLRFLVGAWTFLSARCGAVGRGKRTRMSAFPEIRFVIVGGFSPFADSQSVRLARLRGEIRQAEPGEGLIGISAR